MAGKILSNRKHKEKVVFKHLCWYNTVTGNGYADSSLHILDQIPWTGRHLLAIDPAVSDRRRFF